MTQEDRIKQQQAWMGRYYGQLEGATITEFIIGMDPEFGDMFPVLKVKLKDGKEIEITIYQDEEGNGPGFIHGLDLAQAAQQQTEPKSQPPAGEPTLDHDEQLKKAEELLKDHGGEMWHSGGGIMLIARHIGEIRFTAAPDETATPTFGVEVTNDDGEVLFFKNGLDADQLVTEWKDQVKKHST